MNLAVTRCRDSDDTEDRDGERLINRRMQLAVLALRDDLTCVRVAWSS